MSDYETVKAALTAVVRSHQRPGAADYEAALAALDRLQGERDAFERAMTDWQGKWLALGAENTRLQARIKELEGERDDALMMYRATAKAELTLQAENTRLRAALEEGIELVKDWNHPNADEFDAIARQALAHADKEES